MYTLSFPGEALELTTLIEVFQLFLNDARLSASETADVQLSRNGEPLKVTRYNGVLTLRQPGAASEIFSAMLEEVYAAWFSREGIRLQPWEVRPSQWDLYFALLDLAKKPALLLSSDQLEREWEVAATRGERFDLSILCGQLAKARFGFAAEGPRVPDSGQTNGRHEVHVAYALAANLPVPAAVLADYAQDRARFRFDLEWATVLLDVPEFRGSRPECKLRHLARIIRREGLKVTPDMAAALVVAMQCLPDDADPVIVDDMLFNRGLLDPLPLPEKYQQPVDVGTPVSDLASRVRELLSVTQRDRELERLEKAKSTGQMSRRQYELGRQITLLEHGRWTFDWPNRFAGAVTGPDVGMLLDVLDTADEDNLCCKQAIREVCDVKLRGLGPVARRRAIFALCGYDEAAQAECEARIAKGREHARNERDARYAKEKAARTRFTGADGLIVNGAQHVDALIANGFSEIRSYPRGASRIYMLVHPQRSEGYTVKAKDGTLDYARSVLRAAT
ncbi:hypothetical protein [Paraburkholderia sp. BL10I2N1]|uniref:hypothetical protein n=1 Tax=Paraburkholderia sp. BL10I2N1 TaxID=1938796 RepID=UPI0010611100|nr:hypothetical protein [Paraburkholderia sp. BL10I2N1]TDN59041.1 hypothetical protein B0G77_8227 [Paraburkholderia sp. BL10I2N1]